MVGSVRLAYLLFVFVGTGILRCHSVLHHTHKSLFRLSVEGHRALRKLLDAHSVVSLSRQHILAKGT